MKYRLGRKQKRVILSEDGTRIIAFVKGNEELAQKTVDILNGNYYTHDEIKKLMWIAFDAATPPYQTFEETELKFNECWNKYKK